MISYCQLLDSCIPRGSQIVLNQQGTDEQSNYFPSIYCKNVIWIV